MRTQHVISRDEGEQKLYWNGCGWTDRIKKAIRYSISEANIIALRMRDNDELAFIEQL